jgi:hypothetical protein
MLGSDVSMIRMIRMGHSPFYGFFSFVLRLKLPAASSGPACRLPPPAGEAGTGSECSGFCGFKKENKKDVIKNPWF